MCKQFLKQNTSFVHSAVLSGGRTHCGAFFRKFFGAQQPSIQLSQSVEQIHVDGSYYWRTTISRVFFKRFCHILCKMGRLLKSLFICGGTSYQKFDNNIDKSDYLCYKCENCGHQGTVKVRSFCFVLNF